MNKPLNTLLDSMSWIVDEYEPATYTTIMLLDLVATPLHLLPIGFDILTAGFATPFAMAGELGIDFGLMIIAFFLTILLEVFKGKKPLTTAAMHGIVSALFMMVPIPLFTMVVIAGTTRRAIHPKNVTIKHISSKDLGKIT